MDITAILGWLGQATTSAAPAAGAAGQTPGQGMGGLIWMMALIFIFFYFIILRPQNKDRKRRQELIDSIKKGDKVITIGGIHGKVTGVDTTNGTVAVQVSTNVTIDFTRTAIATVISKDEHGE